MAVSENKDQSKPKKGDKLARLDEVGIDEICYMIEHDDLSYADIATKFLLSKNTLINWLESDPNRSARAREARKGSAKRCDELALAALEAIPDDGTKAQIARQREIASHYRWRAKVRNPAEFGDRQAIEINDITPKTQDEVDNELLALIRKAKK